MTGEQLVDEFATLCQVVFSEVVGVTQRTERLERDETAFYLDVSRRLRGCTGHRRASLPVSVFPWKPHQLTTTPKSTSFSIPHSVAHSIGNNATSRPQTGPSTSAGLSQSQSMREDHLNTRESVQEHPPPVYDAHIQIYSILVFAG